MEISIGAGIQPIKAIRNKILSPLGNICEKTSEVLPLKNAIVTARTLLIVRTRIMTFMTLSNNLYLPINNML